MDSFTESRDPRFSTSPVTESTLDPLLRSPGVPPKTSGWGGVEDGRISENDAPGPGDPLHRHHQQSPCTVPTRLDTPVVGVGGVARTLSTHLPVEKGSLNDGGRRDGRRSGQKVPVTLDLGDTPLSVPDLPHSVSEEIGGRLDGGNDPRTGSVSDSTVTPTPRRTSLVVIYVYSIGVPVSFW